MSPGLPQSQKEEVAGILSALETNQSALFRYADRNYLKACFRRGFLGVKACGSKRSVGGRAGVAVVHRRVRRALNSWTDFSQRRERRVRLLRGALYSLNQRQLRRGLNSWKADAAEKREALDRLYASAKRWAARASGAAYLTWAETTQATRSLAARARGAARAVIDSRSRRALNTWLDFSKGRARGMRLLRSAITAFQRRQWRRALNAWKAEAAAKGRALQSLETAVGSWVGRESGRALRQWLEWLGQREHLRHAANNVVYSKVRRALNQWREFSGAAARRTRLMRGAARSLAQRRHRRALNSWVADWARRVVMARAAACAALHPVMRRAYNSWRSGEGSGVAQRQRMAVAVQEWVGFGLRRGWGRWRELVWLVSTQLGLAAAPPSDFAWRTMRWMRERAGVAHDQMALRPGDERCMGPSTHQHISPSNPQQPVNPLMYQPSIPPHAPSPPPIPPYPLRPPLPSAICDASIQRLQQPGHFVVAGTLALASCSPRLRRLCSEPMGRCSAWCGCGSTRGTCALSISHGEMRIGCWPSRGWYGEE